MRRKLNVTLAHHLVEAPHAPASRSDEQEYEAVQYRRVTAVGNGKNKGPAFTERVRHPVSERH